MIPAKYYYDDATQDQWQQKKKSKKELQSNKRAKLDPNSKNESDNYSNSHASAKDVMNNIAKTAKKVNLPSANKFNARREGEEVRKEDEVEEEEEEEEVEDKEKDEEEMEEDLDDTEEREEESLINGSQLVFDDDGNEVNFDDSYDRETAKKTKKKSKELVPEEKIKRDENLLKLRQKLSDRINLLREKRKAPGSKNGGVIKSRDEILAERKKKAEIRKQEKLKRKLEEAEGEGEGESETEDESEDEKPAKQDNSILFGNIVFNDGSRVTSDLNRLRSTAEGRKSKGPANKDIKAHLLKLEQKKKKLLALSPEEQQKQAEKDKWQRVMAQAEGIKIKDDEKLLKKALKRKEKQKLKSEIEWKDRKQVVKDTVAARAKRREENLKARRDNKGKKGKKNPVRLRKFSGIVNKKAGKKRAGFEGSAKSKGKGKK